MDRKKRDIVACMGVKKGWRGDGQRQKERGSWIDVCEKMMFKKTGGGLGGRAQRLPPMAVGSG